MYPHPLNIKLFIFDFSGARRKEEVRIEYLSQSFCFFKKESLVLFTFVCLHYIEILNVEFCRLEDGVWFNYLFVHWARFILV